MKRWGHSATVLSSSPTSMEILVFGGCTRGTWSISATTLLILGELFAVGGVFAVDRVCCG